MSHTGTTGTRRGLRAYRRFRNAAYESEQAALFGNSLDTLMADARDIAGFTPAGGLNPDTIYTDDQWARWINQSRDKLITEIGPSILRTDEYHFDATGERFYDLMASGFLRLDRVGYTTGAAANALWLTLRERSQALGLAGDPDTTGTPWVAYEDGVGGLGLLPPPSTGTVYVQGPRLPVPLDAGNDRTELPRLLNEVVALGAASRCCRHDPHRHPELAAKRSELESERMDSLENIKKLLARLVSVRGGYTVAEGLRGMVDTRRKGGMRNAKC